MLSMWLNNDATSRILVNPAIISVGGWVGGVVFVYVIYLYIVFHLIVFRHYMTQTPEHNPIEMMNKSLLLFINII